MWESRSRPPVISPAVPGVGRFLARRQRYSPKRARPQSSRAGRRAHARSVDTVVTSALRLARDRPRVTRRPVPTSSSKRTNKKSYLALMSPMTSEAEKASTERSAATNAASVLSIPLAVFGAAAAGKCVEPQARPVSLRVSGRPERVLHRLPSGQDRWPRSYRPAYPFEGPARCARARRRASRGASLPQRG